MMEWDLQINVWNVLSFAATGAVGIYAHIIARQRITEGALEQHKEQIAAALNGFGQRLVRVEEAGRHAPTHDHLGEMYQKLDLVNSKLSELVGKVGGLEGHLRLINEHLLDQR